MTLRKLLAAVRKHRGSFHVRVWLNNGNCLWVETTKSKLVQSLIEHFGEEHMGDDTGLEFVVDADSGVGSLDTEDE